MGIEFSEFRNKLRLPSWQKADIEAELAAHLQEAAIELRAQGKGEAEAKTAALARFGDLDSLAEELQEIHKDWQGGATVQIRLRNSLLLGAVFCIALLMGIFLVTTLLGPFNRGYVMRARVEKLFAPLPFITTLRSAAFHHNDPKTFMNILVPYKAENPRVTWMAVIDEEGMLCGAQPDLDFKLYEPLPEASRLLPKELPGGDLKWVAGGAHNSDIFRPLSQRLKTKGVKVKNFLVLPLGEYEKAPNRRGAAILALAPSLWTETISAMLTDWHFWAGFFWLILAPTAIYFDRRRQDSSGVWIWIAIAVTCGPLAWLGYLFSRIFVFCSKGTASE